MSLLKGTLNETGPCISDCGTHSPPFTFSELMPVLSTQGDYSSEILGAGPGYSLSCT